MKSHDIECKKMYLFYNLNIFPFVNHIFPLSLCLFFFSFSFRLRECYIPERLINDIYQSSLSLSPFLIFSFLQSLFATLLLLCILLSTHKRQEINYIITTCPLFYLYLQCYKRYKEKKQYFFIYFEKLMQKMFFFVCLALRLY